MNFVNMSFEIQEIISNRMKYITELIELLQSEIYHKNRLIRTCQGCDCDEWQDELLYRLLEQDAVQQHEIQELISDRMKYITELIELLLYETYSKGYKKGYLEGTLNGRLNKMEVANENE